MVKFWMHVSPEEQLRRFEDRAGDPLRSWKLTDEDWRNRGRREEYEAAVDAMFAETDKPRARWKIIAGDNKPYARVAVLEHMCHTIEKALTRRGYDLHDAD